MSVLQPNVMREEIIQSGLLLDTLDDPGTELDYEDNESLQEFTVGKHDSQTSMPITSEADNPIAMSKQTVCIKSTLKASQVEDRPAQLKSDLKEMYKSCQLSMETKVLDLHRMADKFARGQVTYSNELEKEVHTSSGFNYDVVTRVDKLLEEAYNMLNNYQKKLDFATRAKLLNLILALNELPHLHLSTNQENKRLSRVSYWLSNHTNHPEPEFCGFANQDPVHIRKFVASLKPKMSTSDTNITLGKRKRGCEDSGADDVTSVCKSGSDTRVCVHADWSRLDYSGKRRRLRYN